MLVSIYIEMIQQISGAVTQIVTVPFQCVQPVHSQKICIYKLSVTDGYITS